VEETEFDTVTRTPPTGSGGVVTWRVLASMNVVVATVPPNVVVAPGWKPLPRIVTAVPPVAGPLAGLPRHLDSLGRTTNKLRARVRRHDSKSRDLSL